MADDAFDTEAAEVATAPGHGQEEKPDEAKSKAGSDQDANLDAAGLRAALVAERKTAKEKQAALEKQLKDQAATQQQIQQSLQDALPYVKALKDNPALVEMIQSGKLGQQAAAGNQEAVELAQMLDLYGPDAKPDAARGAKLLELVSRLADARAEAKIQPYAAMTASDKSAVNLERALQWAAPDGRKPTPETLRMMWNNLPPHVTANDQAAATVAYTALGYDMMEGKAQIPPKPPDDEPLYTEASSRRGNRKYTLTDADKSIAAGFGKTAEDWAKNMEGYEPGPDGALLEE